MTKCPRVNNRPRINYCLWNHGIFPSNIQLGSGISHASCMAITSPPRKFMNHFLGISFCKISHFQDNEKLLYNVYIFSNFLKSPVFLALIYLSQDLYDISSRLHYKAKISVFTNSIFVQDLTHWALKPPGATAVEMVYNNRELLILPQGILFQPTIQRHYFKMFYLFKTICHAMLIKH